MQSALKPLLASLALIITLGAATPAQAADFGMMMAMQSIQMQNVILTNSTNKMMFDQQMDRMKQDHNQRYGTAKPGSSGSDGNSNGAANSANKLTYQPDARVSEQIKKEVLDGLVAEMTKRGRYTADNEKMLRNAMGKIQIAEYFAAELKTVGLVPNDAAAAFTTFVSVGFSVLNDVNEYPAEQNKALYRQIKAVMADSAKSTSDVQLQKFAEMMYWTTFFNVMDYGNAKKETPGYTVQNVKASVAQSMKTLRIDPTVLAFGKSGLQKVR
jgi:hypothetical protein